MMRFKYAKGFWLSVGLHILVLGAAGFFVKPAQFGVDAGQDGGIEVEMSVDTVANPAEQVSLPVQAPSESSDFVDQSLNASTDKNVSQSQGQTAHKEGSGSQGGASAQPNYLQNPAPEYPTLARKRGQEGVVMVQVKVNAEGHPIQVDLKKSSGYLLLDESALKAVKRWSFRPAYRLGMAVESTVDVPVRFRLKE